MLADDSPAAKRAISNTNWGEATKNKHQFLLSIDFVYEKNRQFAILNIENHSFFSRKCKKKLTMAFAVHFDFITYRSNFIYFFYWVVPTYNDHWTFFNCSSNSTHRCNFNFYSMHSIITIYMLLNFRSISCHKKNDWSK